MAPFQGTRKTEGLGGGKSEAGRRILHEGVVAHKSDLGLSDHTVCGACRSHPSSRGGEYAGPTQEVSTHENVHRLFFNLFSLRIYVYRLPGSRRPRGQR